MKRIDDKTEKKYVQIGSQHKKHESYFNKKSFSAYQTHQSPRRKSQSTLKKISAFHYKLIPISSEMRETF